MKTILTFILITLGASVSSSADSFWLKGIPYPPPKIEILWKAATTNLPAGLWIYKMVPRDYSMAVISNALAMSSLQIRNIVNPHDTNQIQFRDKKDIWESRRRLTINPSLGLIEFYGILSSREIPEGVPSDQEAVKLAMHYLFLLGVDRSEMITPLYVHTDVATRSNYKTGRTLWEGPYQCSVDCERRIDGLKAIGGNFSIIFSSHAAIKSFGLSWPDLSPYECHPIADKNEIMNYIKDGQAVLPVPEFHFEKLAGMKKLTVTKITPYYFFEPASDGLFHPFAELEVTADLGNTNFDFQLRCPILSTNTVAKP